MQNIIKALEDNEPKVVISYKYKHDVMHYIENLLLRSKAYICIGDEKNAKTLENKYYKITDDLYNEAKLIAENKKSEN